MLRKFLLFALAMYCLCTSFAVCLIMDDRNIFPALVIIFCAMLLFCASMWALLHDKP